MLLPRMSLGKQVGRELQAAEIARDALGQGLGHQRLADAGHVFQQHVLAREQRDQAPADDVGLAQHDAAHVLFELRDQPMKLLAGSASRSFAAAA